MILLHHPRPPQVLLPRQQYRRLRLIK